MVSSRTVGSCLSGLLLTSFESITNRSKPRNVGTLWKLAISIHFPQHVRIDQEYLAREFASEDQTCAKHQEWVNERACIKGYARVLVSACASKAY